MPIKPNILESPKNGKYVVKILTYNTHTKFQSIYLYIWLCSGKKADKGDDVTF